MKLFFLLILLWIYNCVPSYSQQVKIDHVITVVNNLDSSVLSYKEAGYSVKQGTLHDNGLINAHIRFTNGTEYELMSLIGKPGDALASNYKAFLDKGQGPVYIALTGLNTSDITKILENAQITYDVTTTKLWNYISFPEESGLAHFFFIDYKYTRSDEPSYTSHKNGATGIESVILRGGSKTVSFLESFGLARAGDTIETPFGTGFLFSTSTGNLIVIDQERSDPNRPILTTCVKLPSGLNCY